MTHIEELYDFFKKMEKDATERMRKNKGGPHAMYYDGLRQGLGVARIKIGNYLQTQAPLVYRETLESARVAGNA